MKLDDFRHAVSIADSAETPLHEQLTEFIRGRIKAGIFQPGEQMIPESELCAALQISRTTVRQSMEALVEEGLLVRYRRRGSFIADTKMRRPISSLYNFSDNMKSLNVKPSSIVLHCEIISPDATVRQKLKMNRADGRVFLLKRLRCGDGKPILVETTYIPEELCPGIEKHDFSSASLYHVLEQEYGLKIVHATEIIAAILIREEEAHQLKCRRREAGYQISRLASVRNGQIIEYTTSVTRADMCEFQLDLYDAAEHVQKTKVVRSLTLKKKDQL